MIDNIQKQMLSHVDMAIDSLEAAMGLVEVNDDYNDGQSKELNALYDKISEAVALLKNIDAKESLN